MAAGNNELISVIIPAYNAERHLKESIESVISQSYTNLEVIVVNDGSVDSTLEIAENIAGRDERVKVVNTTHRGLSAARNLGVEQSIGKWVTFLDSDDRLYPEALQRLYRAIVQTQCKIAVGRIVRGWNPVTKHQSPAVRTIKAEEAIRLTLYQTSWLLPSACGKLYYKQILQHELFTEGMWYEDLDFFYRAYLAAREIALTEEPVYYYYDNPHGMTGEYCESRLDVLTVMEQMEDYFANVAPQLLPAVRDRRMSANFNILGILSAQKQTGHEREMTKCWEQIVKNRRESLFSLDSRLKNRCGALMSYLGYDATRLLLGKAYGKNAHVMTLSEEEFQEECRRLATKIKVSGFSPNLVIGIHKGGVEVANNLGFQSAKRVDIVIEKRNGGRNNVVRNILVRLPRPINNMLRIIDLRLKGKRNRGFDCLRVKYIAQDGTEVNLENMFSEIGNGKALVVDDAVDYGVTMQRVLKELQKKVPEAEIITAAITVTTQNPIQKPDFQLYNDALIRFPWSIDAVK